MKRVRKVFVVLLMVVLCVGVLVGCNKASRVSRNISNQADNFNVLRQLTVINNMTNDVIYVMTGKFSIEVDEVESQLEVVVENDDETYSKHFVGLNEMTTYTVIDLDMNHVNPYKFTVNYNPDLWLPLDFENIE